MIEVRVIYAPVSTIKKIKIMLEKEKIEYEETEEPEYLIVYSDPEPVLKQYLSSQTLKKVKVYQMDNNESYTGILKDYGIFGKLIDDNIEPGDTVKIKSGPLKGTTAIVEKVDRKNRTATLIMTVWGQPYKEEVELSKLEKLVLNL